MEKNQQTMKKKNMSIKIVTSGGGGLAGIILLGGALATMAFFSTFAYKRKQKSNKSCKVVKEDDADKLLVGEGLSFLVTDSLSPQLNHHSSNGTQSESVSMETMILDETSQVNGEKDEEIVILKKAKESLLCDESVTSMEFPVPVADSSLFPKPEGMKKNDRLEGNAVLKVDEKIRMADSYQVGVVDNDQHVQLEEDEVCDGIGKNFYENGKQLAEAALNDQVEVYEKEHMPAEKCNENGEVMIKRKDVFVEVPQSEQLGIDYDYHKLKNECDGNGQVLVEKREELVEEAVVDQVRADDDPYKAGEEFVGDVAANGIQLNEKLEFTAMYEDQDILCSDGKITNRHGDGTCDVKKTDMLLPMIGSLLKPADNDLVESPLVIEDTKILEGGEANETAVQEDSIRVEDRGQTQLVEANEDNEIYRETTDDELEDADETRVQNDQQSQPCEEYQKNHINMDQKDSSDKPSPEINSFPRDDCEVQEFSFPLLDSPPYFNFRKLIKNDYSETALHMEDVSTMEKDRSANEVFAYQIMLKNKPSVQLAKNDEMKSFNDGSESDVAEGRETLETGLMDFGDGSKNDEKELEIIQTGNFELENNQQSPLKEDNCYNDNVNREEVSDSTEDEENSDSDEADTVDEDKESSETIEGSSFDSNADAILPVESVQELSQKVKHIQANNHNFMETERGDNYFKFNRHKLEEEDKGNFKMFFSNKLTAEITTLRQPTKFSNLKFWFLSLLVPFLLLLWLLSSQMSSPGSSQFIISDYFFGFH